MHFTKLDAEIKSLETHIADLAKQLRPLKLMRKHLEDPGFVSLLGLNGVQPDQEAVERARLAAAVAAPPVPQCLGINHVVTGDVKPARKNPGKKNTTFPKVVNYFLRRDNSPETIRVIVDHVGASVQSVRGTLQMFKTTFCRDGKNDRRTERNRQPETAVKIRQDIDAILELIAADKLGVDTLREQGSDRLDFHDLGVATLKAALLAAYEKGMSDAIGQMGQPVRLLSDAELAS